MDVLIPDSWLRDFLKTKVTPERIATEVSKASVSIEKITQFKKDSIYNVEVTTNRIDCASVLGLARETALVLKRAGVAAICEPPMKYSKSKFSKTTKYLKASVDSKLCPRFSAVLINDVTVTESPSYIKERLEAVGIRSINNIVDISNYIMIEYGQPVHTFDWDKIGKQTMILREAKKGESITTLDGQKHSLSSGDIIIEDGNGEIIDLAGIMGGANSAISKTTKNVLIFVQTYNPVNIRKTSMRLAHRTQAATYFEKGLDTELVSGAIGRAIDLFEGLTGGKAQAQILDIYPKKPVAKKVTTTSEYINKYLGVSISNKEITNILVGLGFLVSWKGSALTATVPSWRSNDVSFGWDLVEEIARIYGYHNLPSVLMKSNYIEKSGESIFDFERKIREILVNSGGYEVYTFSLVSQEMTAKDSLQLINPLGSDSAFLRQSLIPSLTMAVNENLKKDNNEKFLLFEIANIYVPVKNKLPNEITFVAGVFANYELSLAKGIILTLLEKLFIDYQIEYSDQKIIFKANNKKIGQIEYMENKISFEFDVLQLMHTPKKSRAFVQPSKFPAQVEDLTIVNPKNILIGDIVSKISTINNVSNVSYLDSYADKQTFRIWYQNPDKTLTNKDVEVIRAEILELLSKEDINLI